jgi:uncharacterized protein (DUF362 family)
LASLAAPDGGWGYVAGQPAHLEPTCLALLALAAEPDRFAEPIRRGLAALEANRQPDGSYRLVRGRPAAVWPTALVLFTRHALGHPADQLAPVARCLLDVRGLIVKADPEVADMNDLDLELVGWPWAERTFSWVEPTAWACLALRHAGHGRDVRVVEGTKLLLDRAFDSGGVNYGNRFILGKPTEPIPGPTAAMLLALQGHGDHPRVAAARAYLRSHALATTDLEHLGWARLALGVHDADPATRDFLPQLDECIRQSYERRTTSNGKTIGPPRLALTALGLSGRNPFRLPEPAADASALQLVTERAAPGTPDGPRPSLMERIKTKFRGVLVNGLSKMQGPPPTSAVHIAAVNDYADDLAAVIRKQFDHFRQHVPMAGKRVVLKPNLVEWHRDKVINTDPRFVDAVIAVCKAEGAAEVVVAEGPGHWRNVQFLVEESGLGDVLKKHGVRFVDLNHDEPVKVMNLGRTTGLEYLFLTRTVTSAEVFISLPKLKTHHWAGATLSLKNLFGTLPGICYGWPKNELHWRGIPQSVIDIALTQTPHLAIVDGIVGMEGDGPLNGTAKHMGVVVMGIDLVAVDATCCRLMKLPTERIPILVLGAMKRLGRMKEEEIPQLGEPIEKLAKAFELPPKIEGMLMPVAAGK